MTREQLIEVIAKTVLHKGLDGYSVIGEAHTRAVLTAIEDSGLAVINRGKAVAYLDAQAPNIGPITSRKIIESVFEAGEI